MAWSRTFLVLMLLSASASATPRDGINAVLGDDSWVEAFGAAPDASVSGDDRVRVHLAFVEERLRAKEVSALDVEQRFARAVNLDRLHAYIERGEFPRNRVFPGNRPHFIDEQGRICAVGYLIEKSAGRAAAEAINAKHEWDYIENIDGIEAWVKGSGLTVEELAMIQPGYGFDPPGEMPAPIRPPHPRPPPPPPPDETTQQRRVILAALANAASDVDECAGRWGMTSRTLGVTVNVQRFAIDATVQRGGNRGFRRCVQRVVDNAIAGRWFRTRRAPMTVSYTFTLEQDVFDDRSGDGFAKPPPR